MQHIFNIAINVEDERIIQSIEKTVEDKVIEKITEKITDLISNRDWYGRVKDYKPLENLVAYRIDAILADHKDLIIEKAADKLAEKLARSKDGKAILDRYKED